MGFKQSNHNQGGYLVFLVFLGMLLPMVLRAQSSLEVGLQGGVAYYNGDINPALPFVMPQAAFGTLARYNFDKRWSVQLSYTHAKVKGDDLISKAVKNRLLNFITTIDDISLSGEFNFMDYFTGSKKTAFSPYLIGGAGFFFYTPRGKRAGQLYDLRALGTEGQNVGYENRKPYKSYSFAAVFGAGIKYSLSKHLGVGVEWTMHKTFTDYLDDVSSTYYLDATTLDPNDLTTAEYFSDPSLSHLSGEQRGNSNNNDWFSFTSLSLTYKINLIKNKGCNGLKW